MYKDETCTYSLSGGTTPQFDNALEVTADTATPNIDTLDPGQLIIKIDIFSKIEIQLWDPCKKNHIIRMFQTSESQSSGKLR